MARKKSISDILKQISRIDDYYNRNKEETGGSYTNSRRWNNADAIAKAYIQNIRKSQRGATNQEKKYNRGTYMGTALSAFSHMGMSYNQGQKGTENYEKMLKRAERNRKANGLNAG